MRKTKPKQVQASVSKPKLTSPDLYVVRDTDTLLAALVAIERNEHRTIVVTNKDNIVVGVLSDGDARMSIIDGRLLSTPVHRIMNADFIAVSPKEHAKARKIMAQGHIFVIPVVDVHGKLLDVHTSERIGGPS